MFGEMEWNLAACKLYMYYCIQKSSCTTCCSAVHAMAVATESENVLTKILKHVRANLNVY